MAVLKDLLVFGVLTVVVRLPSGLGHPGVITVIVRPSDEIFGWPEDTNKDLENGFVVTGNPDQVWNEEIDSVVFVDNNRLLSFFRKDTHHQSCPIDLFRDRIIGYVTARYFSLAQSCPDLSDVISGVTLPMVVWSFDLSTFMSQFLVSWTNSSSQPSYTLLFDRSGREHFLDANSSFAGDMFVFESTFPVYNCSDTALVVKTAATTDIRDIVMIATTHCVFNMFKAVSQLRLPPTRFRWMLYPTDSTSGPGLELCVGLENYCDQVKPLLLVERGKPRDRPIDTETKLLQFADRSLAVFTEAVVTQGEAYNCSMTCTGNCSGCQTLFKESVHKIKGQDYELFPADSETERKNIVFDIYRLASVGNIQIGNWSAQHGLSLRDRAYPQNFTDTKLTVVVVLEPPFVFREDKGPHGVAYSGYSLDVLEHISKKIGFEYEVAECSPGSYGSLQDGQWTGCIGNVVRGEADVILGALTVTVERDKVVDFTLPYYDFAGIQIMMKRDDSSTKRYYYASVFTTPAWLSIFGVLAVTSILLWAFERITQTNGKTEPPAPKETFTNSVALSIISSDEPGLKLHDTNENTTRAPAGKRPPTLNDSNANNEITLSGYVDESSTKTANLGSTEKMSSNNNSSAHLITDGLPTLNDEGGVHGDVGLDSSQDGNETDPTYSIGDSIWFVVGALTMAGGGEPPRSLAGRVLIAGFWFFTVIIMSTFTANLAAFLTVSRLGTSVSSLDDLAGQKEINYSAVVNTSVAEYFKRMANIEKSFYEDWKSMSLKERSNEESSAVWDYPLGNKYNAIWNAIQRNGLIESNEEGLVRVKAGGFALITESPVIRYYTGIHCDLEAVGEQFSTRPYAIGLKENSPYRDLFSQAILDLQKERVLGNLQFSWWSDNSQCSSDDHNGGLGLYLLSGTFIVAGVGLALGVLALGLEHLIVKVKGLKVTSSATKNIEQATRKDSDKQE